MHKKTHLAIMLLMASCTLSAQITYTWTGILNSDWSNGVNWLSLSPGTTPGPMDDVVIAGTGVPVQPVLTSDVSVRNVSITAGASLDLRGFTIQISELLNMTTGLGLLPARSSINAGFIETGRITTNNARLNAIELTLLGAFAGNSTINGQSVIDGPCTFTNSKTNNTTLVLASTLSSSVVCNDLVIFNRDLANIHFGTRGTVTFNDEIALNMLNTGTANFASQGNVTFNNNLYLNSSVGGTVTFGSLGGASTMTAGAAILTGSGYSGGGTIDFINFNQLSSAPNGFFEPNTFNAMDCFFGGEWALDVLNLTLTNSSFEGLNDFIFRNGNVSSCTFNFNGGVPSGSTTFTKAGATAVNWGGNNTFHSDFNFVRNGNGMVNLASAGGNIYRGVATFINNNAPNSLNPLSGAGIKSQFFSDISTLGSAFPVSFGPGIMEIRGNSARSFVGNPLQNHTITNLELNMTGLGNLTIGIPIQISGYAMFTYGVLNSSIAAPLVFLDNATLAIVPSNDSYVDGPVGKIGDDAFIFPVGNGGFFAPIAISAPAIITDSYAAQYFHQDPSSFGGDNLLSGGDHISNAEYWALGASGGSSSVNVTLSWAGRSGGVTDLSELVLAQWDGADWVDAGTGGTAGSTSAGLISTSSALSLGAPSYFTLGSLTSLSNPLPIELLSFSARLQENKMVALNWATATEHNNAFFEIERSKDGIHYTAIGQISGAGDSYKTLYYQFIDASPLEGTSYYRLRQVDTDDSFSYSAIVAIEVKSKIPKMEIFPNPVSETLHVQWEGPSPELSLFNSAGQEIETTFSREEGQATCRVNSLIPGFYWLRIASNEGVNMQRIVVK